MPKQTYVSKNFNNQTLTNAQGLGSSSNQVYEVADITARDAIASPNTADIAKVADDGTGSPKDYIWNGTTWIAFAVGSGGGSSNANAIAVAATPTNYSPSAANVEDHLSAIDLALASGGSNSRELLTSDRTYFVSPTGSDSNDGLTTGTPFLTIQKAINTIASLDWAGIYLPTIQLADGIYSYATNINLKSVVGTDKVIVRGNETTPSNVVVEITESSTYAFVAINLNSTYSIENLKVIFNQSTTGSLPSGAIRVASSYLEVNNVIVEATDVQSNSIQWFRVEDNGTLYIPSGGSIEFLPYIAGTPSQYIGFAAVSGTIRMNGINFILASTPNFSVFVSAERVASIFANSFTTSGTATGQKFEVAKVANLFAGGNATNLPGDVAGIADAASFGNVE